MFDFQLMLFSIAFSCLFVFFYYRGWTSPIMNGVVMLGYFVLFILRIQEAVLTLFFFSVFVNSITIEKKETANQKTKRKKRDAIQGAMPGSYLYGILTAQLDAKKEALAAKKNHKLEDEEVLEHVPSPVFDMDLNTNRENLAKTLKQKNDKVRKKSLGSVEEFNEYRSYRETTGQKLTFREYMEMRKSNKL